MHTIFCCFVHNTPQNSAEKKTSGKLLTNSQETEKPHSVSSQTGKNTPIRRTAVRGNGVSRHHGGPPETPKSITALSY